MPDVKRFKLHDPSMSIIEIANRLGHGVASAYPTFEIRAGFIGGTWVGARNNHNPLILLLDAHRLELHEFARTFADEILSDD